MASEVKTNKISPATSTTINVGDSGDTLALAVDDVTGFNVGSDAAGDILYNDGTDYTRLAKPGTPADEVLTFATGASAPSWVAAAAGGLTAASQWRLTTDFTGTVTPIASNLEEADAPVGFGVLGSSMTESSGIFTFPSTGYWYIEAFLAVQTTTDSTSRSQLAMQTTINDSTYAHTSEANAGTYYETSTGTCSYIMDVTDVTQCKVRFSVSQTVAGVTTKGDTSWNETFFTFMRLADT